MELMKSHLHGDNGFESVDIFRKLVHVMEMATKHLFNLIDVSGVNTTPTSSSDVIESSVTSRLHEVSYYCTLIVLLYGSMAEWLSWDIKVPSSIPP